MLKAVLMVTSPYDDKVVKLIEERFTEMTGDKIIFEIRADDSLIGGFKAFINGQIYDASVASRIAGMNKFLAESAEQSDFWMNL